MNHIYIYILNCFTRRTNQVAPSTRRSRRRWDQKKLSWFSFFFRTAFFSPGTWQNACIPNACVCWCICIWYPFVSIKKIIFFFPAAQFSFFFLLSVLEHGGQAAVKWLDTKDIVEGWGGVTDEAPSRLDASFLVAVHTNIFFVFLGGV